MVYDKAEVRKALEVLLPDYRHKEIEIFIREDLLADADDEERFYYEAYIEKGGKERLIGTFFNSHIRDALKSLSKVYGYVRVSRKEQSIDRQIRNIEKEYPKAHIVREDGFTGTTMDRPEWNKLYKRLKAGDIVVFDSVSRMARTAEEGIETYFDLYERGVSLVFLKEHYIDTDVYAENTMDRIELQGTDEDEIFKGLNNYFRKLAKRQIRIAFEQAEKEVQDLRQRTKEGIETARLKGKQVGQRKGNRLTIKKEAPAKEVIKKHSKTFGGSLSDKECMSLAKISRNTYYKYKRELLQEEEHGEK